MIPNPDITDWIFDLDNTLYRADSQFFSQIDVKITQFLCDYLSVDPVEAHKVQKQYLIDYGTTLSGLVELHDLDPYEFLDFVHDIDLAPLSPNPDLRRAIEALPGRKFIFTNGSKKHAENVGTHIELFDLFDGHFGVEDMEFVPKPMRPAYDKFCGHFDIDPSRAIMFEDNIRNLKVPKALGMQTVLVVSDVDWSHEPESARPAGIGTREDFIDVVTDDLPQWLLKNTAKSIGLAKLA